MSNNKIQSLNYSIWGGRGRGRGQTGGARGRERERNRNGERRENDVCWKEGRGRVVWREERMQGKKRKCASTLKKKLVVKHYWQNPYMTEAFCCICSANFCFGGSPAVTFMAL